MNRHTVPLLTGRAAIRRMRGERGVCLDTRAAPAKADHVVEDDRLRQAHRHARAIERREQQGRSAERRMEQEAHPPGRKGGKALLDRNIVGRAIAALI